MGFFRDLKAEEIDCRIQSINDKGLMLLLYKDARVDQNILDETLGIFGWQRTHQVIDGRLYCTVSVYDKEKAQWISKQDVGTESNTEKEKGEASDSFKRACFNLGIGRELYTAPFIWIDKGKYKEAKDRNGKPTTYDKFKVSEIKIQNGTITGLAIVNTNNKNTVVFTFGKIKASSKGDKSKDESKSEECNNSEGVDAGKSDDAKINAAQVESLRTVCIRHNLPEKELYNRYKRGSLEDMTVGDWKIFAVEGKEILDEWDKNYREDNRATA
nr:MAG TPA: Rad52/22 family double-strand break repair protein [Caudoviricetes sp.]